MALGAALRKAQKRVTVALADEFPAYLRFLPAWEEVHGAKADLTGVNLIFVLDLSDVDRVGSLYNKALFSAVPIINIDHHPTNTNFGSVNFVAPEAAATCELLPPIIKSLGVDIDKEIASCLLTGLITDTIGFRTSNTTTATVRMAADMMEYGVSLPTIADAVFNSKPLTAVKLLGLAASQVQVRGRIVWTSVTRSMLAEAGANLEDSESIVGLLASVRDVEAAIVFKETEDGMVRVSIRTTGRLNAGQICQGFGGGGHLRAGGCGLRAGLQIAQQTFLTSVEDALAS